MEYLVTSREMQHLDEVTINELGVPGIVLMERAAAGACAYMTGQGCAKDPAGCRITVLCGYGNNGGDGLALARMLYQKHLDVRVILTGNPDKATQSNRLEQQIATRYGLDISAVDISACSEALKDVSSEDIIVDALFGVGLSRPLSGDWAALADAVNACGAYVYSLDIPSGLSADGGGYSNTCVHADATLTFGFNKLGLMTYPGASYAGDIVLIDMGIDEFSIRSDKPVYRRFTNRSDISWPHRSSDANKGTYGKILLIAGSADVFGAAYMAARAAFAMGVGMVRIITHTANRVALETALPEAMYSFYDDDTSDKELCDMVLQGCKWADGILVGPGIGTGHTAETLVRCVAGETDLPVVADADAIRILADNEEFLSEIGNGGLRPVILTPHMGEYAYLIHTSVGEAKEHVVTDAVSTAEKLGITLICKDARSVIASCSHPEVYINTSGNEGMATAGSGDVLAGMCAVMMIQTGDALSAAASAAYLHGLAGDDAAARCGSVGMTASDIIDSIKGRIYET